MVATSTNVPARRIPTLAQSCSTSDRMCDERNTVCPRPAASPTQRRNSCSISGSSPLVGSSRSSTSALVANAATSATFCRLPFEYVRERLSSSSENRSTSSAR